MSVSFPNGRYLRGIQSSGFARLAGNILNGVWVNHTISTEDQSYLGSQGYPNLFLDEQEMFLLDLWGVKLF